MYCNLIISGAFKNIFCVIGVKIKKTRTTVSNYSGLGRDPTHKKSYLYSTWADSPPPDPRTFMTGWDRVLSKIKDLSGTFIFNSQLYCKVKITKQFKEDYCHVN